MLTSICGLLVKTTSSEVKLWGANLIYGAFNNELQYPMSQLVICKVGVIVPFTL